MLILTVSYVKHTCFSIQFVLKKNNDFSFNTLELVTFLDEAQLKDNPGIQQTCGSVNHDKFALITWILERWR